MDRITNIFFKIKENYYGRIVIHLFFWMIIWYWIWSDYHTADISKNGSDDLLIIVEMAFIFICFYVLDYGLKKSFSGNIFAFIVTLCIIFISSEYFLYWLFTYFPTYSSGAYVQHIVKAFNNPQIFWWNLWLNRKVFYFAMAFHFFYLIVPFGIKSIYELFNYVQKNQRLQKENIQLELNFLRSQVNPHFLFNTLNNIYAMAEGTDENVANMVLKLSDLMRYSLYESNKEKIALSREVNFLENYIELEQIRLSKRATIKFIKDGDFNNFLIPPLILLTFVENSFKHGIHATKEKAWVQIKLLLQDDMLSFECENSVSEKPIITNLNKVGGIGLVNARKRLEIYYPKQYSLIVQNNFKNYLVNLTINLKRE